MNELRILKDIHKILIVLMVYNCSINYEVFYKMFINYYKVCSIVLFGNVSFVLYIEANWMSIRCFEAQLEFFYPVLLLPVLSIYYRRFCYSFLTFLLP